MERSDGRRLSRRIEVKKCFTHKIGHYSLDEIQVKYTIGHISFPTIQLFDDKTDLFIGSILISVKFSDTIYSCLFVSLTVVFFG